MRWKAKESPRPKMSEWHVFFPIFPRKVGDHWVCFEKILRKGTLHVDVMPDYYGGSGDVYWTWEYKYYGDLMS